MKPLLTTQLAAFSERFLNFKDAEWRSLEVVSPFVMRVTFAVQDSARAYDWITVSLEFNGVNDAKLLQENKISFIDMSEGISLINDENSFAFGIGECYNISTIKSSSCFIVATTLKYEEGLF